MRLALQLLSVAVSLLAAGLWWCGSRQPRPPAISAGEVPDLSVYEGMRSSARWNSWAVRCTALAVVLQAASGLWG